MVLPKASGGVPERLFMILGAPGAGNPTCTKPSQNDDFPASGRVWAGPGHVFGLLKSLFSGPGRPLGPRFGLRIPPSRARGAQEAQRGPQEAPKRPQEGPKNHPGDPKRLTSGDFLKRHTIASQDGLKSLQNETQDLPKLIPRRRQQPNLR